MNIEEVKIKLNSKSDNVKQLIPKDLGIRKKLDIFIDNISNKESTLILNISAKSRFLHKDVDKIEEILAIVQNHANVNITSKTIIISSPLCSKAKTKLIDLSWEVIVYP